MEHALEGPLAHAARVVSEETYLAGLTETYRHARERAAGGRPETVSKRLLVTLSHAIEKAVMSGPVEHPTVVVAMFQRLPFFDREREVYGRMAAAGVEVVVGFVDDDGAPTPPPGVHAVRLRAGERLADEWTVVAVGPRAGAFLVATDQHAVDPDEPDEEAARRFAGRWGFAHTQAASELARLRFALGDRLDTDARARIDNLLAWVMPAGAESATSAGTPGETWASCLLHHLLERVHAARAGTQELRDQLADTRGAVAAQAAATDPRSGLAGPEALDAWAGPAGPSTPPTGLLLIDVPALAGLHDDPRAAHHGARQVAAALTGPLGPVDVAVRLTTRSFLVVVPGASSRHLAALADDIGTGLELASHGYPDVSFRAAVATTVSRVRPLPLDDLHDALTRLARDQDGPLDAGATPAGEHITVASTRLHGRTPEAREMPESSDAREVPEASAAPRTPNAPADSTPETPAAPSPPAAPGPPASPSSPAAASPASPSPVPPGARHAGPPVAREAEVPLPRRTAQAALHHLVHGDEDGPGAFGDLTG